MKVSTRHSIRPATRAARLPQRGFTLIELVITVFVLAILTLGVIPLVQVSAKRQKEEELRAYLREMREAFDQFHREGVVGAQMQTMQPGSTAQQEQAPRPPQAQNQASIFGDPRVRVFISDQTIFGVDNPDRYPPDLETLVNGVDVLPITAGGLGRRGQMGVSATDAASPDSVIPKIKIYLRRIPVDPMTGKADWCLRSSYDTADTSCDGWGGENVFDVRSRSEGTALNGTKYRDW
ncbi:MAG TPA: prepilin-type N-terminal cleavage/methylation domain-containing protein [Pyrinomonadaceae bacterium]|nr:prepilin-type N-terminal cleavage/methylation domain-containing protein [Pyrinomonadaceae bacterium]